MMDISTVEDIAFEACKSNNFVIFEKCCPYIDKVLDQLFYAACMYGSFKIARYMIKHGMVDINKTLDILYDYTALHIVIDKNYDIAHLLIKYNADLNRQDKMGKTPLHYACTYEQARLLLDAGAKLDIADDDGKTPLDYAVETVNRELVKLFLVS